jgi:glutamate racemase
MDVKDVVKTAITHFKFLFPDAEDILLEEVELVEKEKVWAVTLSALLPKPKLQRTSAHNALSELRSAMQPDYRRIFRVVRIDMTGKVVAMKMAPVGLSDE